MLANKTILIIIFCLITNCILVANDPTPNDITRSVDKIFEDLVQYMINPNVSKMLLLRDELCQKRDMAIPFLINKLDHDDLTVSFAAAMGLEQINDKSIVDKLLDKISGNSIKNLNLGVSVYVGIGLSNEVDILPSILNWIDSTNTTLASASITGCGTIIRVNNYSKPDIAELLMRNIVQKLAHQNKEVRSSAIFTLTNVGHPSIIPYLLDKLEEELITAIELSKKRPLTETHSEIIKDKIISLASLFEQDFGYDITRSMEINKLSVEKHRGWYLENKSYLYHHPTNIIKVNEEAKALKIPVNPETGKMIDPKYGHELTPEEIEQIKKSKSVPAPDLSRPGPDSGGGKDKK